MNTVIVNQMISMLIVGMSGLRALGIDYQRVIQKQEQAAAENRSMTAAERQEFLNESQQAIDQL